MLIGELLFTEALRTGDTWVLEYVVHDPTGEPAQEYAHAVRATEEHFLLEIRFDPAAPPAGCHSYTQAGLDEPRLSRTDLVLNKDNAVHLAVSDGTAGVVGIAWDWPRREPRSDANPGEASRQ
ncbi:hypothetical protein [Amycolatopsis saalfeldensis]|uniref:Uncharacterized protein n=1 Tax=Amycolatopsis saalfeldensis TaxID=394193 RepID=A0A1H8YG28_9PSEU|nr:hypothetical protein [Amycolatopsis saalfeldensis]SEP51067.1 hypothetical protein SAMN04489732_115132 [Amycolatopsis saalfeldensis]